MSEREPIALDPSWGAHQISSDKSILERTGVAPRLESSEKKFVQPSVADLHARPAGAVTSDSSTGVDFEGPGSQYRRPTPLPQDSADEASEPVSLAERMGFVKRPRKPKAAPDSSVAQRMGVDRRPVVSNPDEIVE